MSRARREKASAFELLEQCSPDQVASLLGRELPQTAALILANMNPTRGAAVFSHLPEAMQLQVPRRIGTPGDVERGVLERVAGALGETMMELAEQTSTIGGAEVLGSLMQNAESDVRERMLASLEKEDQALTAALRDLDEGDDSEEGSDD